MANFNDYVRESDKTYRFRIKTVIPVDEDFYNKMKTFLPRYGLKNISDVKRTMIQDSPMDFNDIRAAEVYIIDIDISVPESTYIFRNELASYCGIPLEYIVVHSEYDQIEDYQVRDYQKCELQNYVDDNNLQKKSLLSTDPNYQEGQVFDNEEDLYGDNYNRNLLACLADIARQRENNEKTIEGKPVFQSGSNEIDPEVKDDNFNKLIKDSILSVPRWENKDYKDIPGIKIFGPKEFLLVNSKDNKGVDYIQASVEKRK